MGRKWIKEQIEKISIVLDILRGNGEMQLRKEPVTP
jgi:hypothetical protein